MSDQEIADLYAALMATEPVATPAAESSIPFPFNIRLAMAGWKTSSSIPSASRRKRGNPSSTIAASISPWDLPIASPATVRAMRWARSTGRAFTGSTGGPGGKAPAITAAALGEAGYDVASLMQTLKDGFTPGFDVLGGAMAEVVSDSTSHWTDGDLEALATYLLSE